MITGGYENVTSMSVAKDISPAPNADEALDSADAKVNDEVAAEKVLVRLSYKAYASTPMACVVTVRDTVASVESNTNGSLRIEWNGWISSRRLVPKDKWFTSRPMDVAVANVIADCPAGDIDAARPENVIVTENIKTGYI